MMRGTDLVRDGRFVKCFEFINDEFFSDLERTMGDVVEPLTAFEEKCKYFIGRGGLVVILFSHGDHLADFVAASEWLATQKIGDFDERCKAYIRSVFPSTESGT